MVGHRRAGVRPPDLRRDLPPLDPIPHVPAALDWMDGDGHPRRTKPALFVTVVYGEADVDVAAEHLGVALSDAETEPVCSRSRRRS